MAEEGFDRIERQLNDLRVDMNKGFTENRRHMGVLHEAALKQVRTLAEGYVALDEKMDRGFADMKETIADELAPIKLAIRHHSVEIARPDTERRRPKRRQ